MRMIFPFCALAGLLVSLGAQAMMAPKFERVRALSTARELTVVSVAPDKGMRRPPSTLCC
jgi:hypothetical protein